MAESKKKPDLAAIHQLLVAAFPTNDLHRFCYYRPMFRAACETFGAHDGVNEMADKLIMFCEKRLIFDELLAEVKRVNPRQYELYAKRESKPDAERLLRSFSAWNLREDYYTHLRIINRSERTIEEYEKILVAFFLETRNFSLEVTPREVRQWLASMRKRGLADRTVASRYSALRSFFAFAVSQGHVPSNPVDSVPKPKIPASTPNPLSPDQVRAFFAAIDAIQDLDRGPRDRVLFRLIYSAGMRVSEVVSLRIEHFDLTAGTVRVEGRGSNIRTLSLAPKVQALVKDWIGESQRGWLFPGQSADKHLSPRTVQIYCQTYGETAGIPEPVSPRVLRDTCAKRYIDAGVPLLDVQRMLGHGSLSSTGRYAKIADVDRELVVQQIELEI